MRVGRESSSEPPVGELAVSRTVILERPPEGFAIEGFRALDVSHTHLDIVDTTIVWQASPSAHLEVSHRMAQPTATPIPVS